MARIEETIFIDRSPEDVFDFVSDVENEPKWQAEVAESKWSEDAGQPGGGPDVAGAGRSRGQGAGDRGRRARTENVFLGRRVTIVGEIAEYQPPTRIEWNVTEPFSMHAETSVRPEDGGTRLTMTAEPGDFGSIFGRLATAMIVRMYGRQLRCDMKNLKDLLEGNAETDL
jgi:uncharacterized protein YndB with AHSA1/START domain